ncbi:FtsX-like permease family protein [Leuconostoc citreum]|uniref:FtsX-like permease family protein n=1 Tax=Leuconostoc citreum TaxID=33964 RepID=UPI001C1F6DEA|nr:ABC transporter permease [Leuconostoc citreum]MBU7450171.1 ABC transporter permease [Leuconostoc citreum]
MFLAINEMLKEKVRYTLVIAVITLISFLIFILSALALGLSNENTAAVNSWHTQSVALNKDADGNLSQSLMTQSMVTNLKKLSPAETVGIAPAIIKYKQNHRDAATYIGLDKSKAIYQTLKIVSGHQPTNQDEVLVSDKLKNKGLSLGDNITIGMLPKKLVVVGFVKQATYNMAPIVYGSLSNWSGVKGVSSHYAASGVISQKNIAIEDKENVSVLTRQQLFNKMPGYTAQNSTFLFMISFLIIISIVVVAIFLYILTIQKMPNLAVLRTQGIPSHYLIVNTLSETTIIMTIAVSLGLVLCAISSWLLPVAVPMYFDLYLIISVAFGLIITGIIAALIPIRLIMKIEPKQGIGG